MAFPACAGSYSAPTFSSGYWTFGDDPNEYPFPQANPYAGDHEDAIFAGGSLVATSTWTPVGNYDTAPQVIVTEVVSAGWGARGVNSKPSAMCTDGFMDPEVDPQSPPGYYSGISSRTNYSLQSPSGNNIKVARSGVSATLDYESTTPPVDDGDVGASWGVTLSPVTIILSGTVTDGNDNPVLDSSGNQQILVGQGCSAGIIPEALRPYTTYSWSISSTGTTFQDWETTTPSNPNASPPTQANSQASYYVGGPGNLTGINCHWYWTEAQSTTETVSCTATITPPTGEGSQFSVMAAQKVAVTVPPYTCFQTPGYVTTSQVTDQNDPNYLKVFLQAASMTYAYPYGDTWNCQVQTPTLFGSGGSCNFCQLITPGRAHTYGSSTVACTQNGIKGLDLKTPYGANSGDPYTVGGSTANAGWPADNSQHQDGDSPTTGVDDPDLGTADSININESFVTTLMYLPPGNDVKPVPLNQVSWLWDASPSEPPGGWLDDVGVVVGSVNPSTPSGTNVFPSWTLIESRSVGLGW